MKCSMILSLYSGADQSQLVLNLVPPYYNAMICPMRSCIINQYDYLAIFHAFRPIFHMPDIG